MTAPRFDPAGFYELDLAKGTVSTRHGDRVLVMTDNVATALVSSADAKALEALGNALGSQAKRELSDVEGASPESVLGHAATALGVFGWGRLGFERWADVLVVSLEQTPDVPHPALATLLGGFISALSGKEVACVAVGGRFVVVHPSIVDTVSTWASRGLGIPAVVAKLGANS